MNISKKNNTNLFTEDWLPISGISNGCIVTDQKEYVTGIKVNPKNIFMYDKLEQERIIFGLNNFYNTIDYEFWLVIADRPVDLGVYLAEMQLLYNNSKDSTEETRKLIVEDINKANSFMSKDFNVVDTEYFILFKEKKPEVIQKRLRNLISGLAGVGLSSVQVTNDDLRMLLDNFLNGGISSKFGMVVS